MPMITDVDTCLKEIADWYIEKRRDMTESELESIAMRHCGTEAEVKKFVGFLETEPGRLRFKTLLRERKVRVSTATPAGVKGEYRPVIGKQVRARPPIIHEAVTENPDPTKFMPIEVDSAFPKGSKSIFTLEEKAYIDSLINDVPDEDDTGAINYWVDWGDKKVYLEGWIDQCLAGTGYPSMGEGEWQAKIDYMVKVGKSILTRKQEEKERPIGLHPPGHLNLIEGGFREFEAGENEWLYGVTWGVYRR